MSQDSKSKMVVSAMVMLAKRGMQGASFSEVLEHSGAPRGSLYHHFPGGKRDLVAAAIALASQHAQAAMESHRGQSARAVTDAFLGMWRGVLTRSQLDAGCSVLAVAVSPEDPELRDAAAKVFREWRRQLAELLELGGLRKADASRFAATLIAASEGAVAISRAERSLEPFELTATMLLDQVGRLPQRVRRSRK